MEDEFQRKTMFDWRNITFDRIRSRITRTLTLINHHTIKRRAENETTKLEFDIKKTMFTFLFLLIYFSEIQSMIFIPHAGITLGCFILLFSKK